MEDVQAYLESGRLEQYALGELDAAGRADVESWARRHPEVRQELDEVTQALDLYANAHALTPPAAMRERVLGRVLAEIGAPSVSPAVAPPPMAVNRDASAAPDAAEPLRAEPRETVVRPLATAPAPAVRSGWSGWALAASVALLLSLGGNVVLYNRWQRTHADLVAAQNDQARFAATTQVVQRRLGAVAEQMRVLRSDQYRAVALAGTKTAPQARARVLFNPATHRVYLDVKSLPALPAGKQYQLWALAGGKPVDAGVLTRAAAAGDSLQQMKDVDTAQAFAMTVEPEGGSANPTLSTMTVIGNI